MKREIIGDILSFIGATSVIIGLLIFIYYVFVLSLAAGLFIAGILSFFIGQLIINIK